MRLQKLRITNLRCLVDVEVVPSQACNGLVGPNGAGKTSVLEGIYLLSRARSFRKGPASMLLRNGVGRMDVYAEIDDRGGAHRIGLAYEEGHWKARVDGHRVERLADLVLACAVVYFGPDSHALVSGPAEERRRFLDWGVFHVEHEFLSHWTRYRKALRQRNAMLRVPDGVPVAMMAAWEREMSLAAEYIDAERSRYLERLAVHLRTVAAQLQPELGAVSLRYRRGWSTGETLMEALAGQRQRDCIRGHTGVGIHRADWEPVFENASGRGYLSRGQQKACAFALYLAQAKLYAHDHGEWPIMCMDDLGAELDDRHRGAAVAQLSTEEMQVFVTGTEPATMPLTRGSCRMFHVEHAHVTCVGDT